MNYIIVLGEKLQNNGTINDILKKRLDRAANIFKTGEYHIIVSGGKVQKSTNHTEAYVMKKYLTENKYIIAEKITKEAKSQNTIENAENTFRLLSKQKNIGKIIVITSKFHMPRSKMIFKHIYNDYKDQIFFLSSQNGIDGKVLEQRIKKETRILRDLQLI